MISKILIFALLVICSTSALLENLFQRESTCYSGCQSNYADQTSFADACKKGCDYKLHNEKCSDQCDLVSSDSQLKSSCLVGCSMVDSINPQEVEPTIGERPRSIILIRLRQRPVLEFPSFNKDPSEFFRDMIQQMNTGASGEMKTFIRLSNAAAGIRADSSSESSEEQKTNVKHFVVFRQEHHQPALNGRFQQVVEGVRREWNDLIHRQPSTPIWLLLLLLLSLSATLWYMIVSLCNHAPTHHNLSIHAGDYEKLQPVEHYVDTLPIKVKLTNI